MTDGVADLVLALSRAGAVLGAADRVGLDGHERVDERGQHLPKQIRGRLLELLV
jgi:hypothetical protein